MPHFAAGRKPTCSVGSAAMEIPLRRAGRTSADSICPSGHLQGPLKPPGAFPHPWLGMDVSLTTSPFCRWRLTRAYGSRARVLRSRKTASFLSLICLVSECETRQKELEGRGECVPPHTLIILTLVLPEYALGKAENDWKRKGFRGWQTILLHFVFNSGGRTEIQCLGWGGG